MSLTAVASTVFAMPADAAAHSRHKRHSTHKSHATASCAARAAIVGPRANEALANCHKRTTVTVKAHAAKPHKAPKPAKIAAPETPGPETPAATEPSPQEIAAEIAAVLATPCQNTELTPEAADLQLVKAAVLCLVNQERAANGRSPLSSNPLLEQAAEGHTQELVQDDYFAHVSPSGETPVDRIRNTGYIPGPSVGYVIGENLAWGTYSLATPRSIVAAWIASPGHLANILEPQYRETGIGITPAAPPSLGEGEPGATYAQEFGVIIH